MMATYDIRVFYRKPKRSIDEEDRPENHSHYATCCMPMKISLDISFCISVAATQDLSIKASWLGLTLQRLWTAP